jgi:hypothetical protein
MFYFCVYQKKVSSGDESGKAGKYEKNIDFGGTRGDATIKRSDYKL